jgi:hypothetical protein
MKLVHLIASLAIIGCTTLAWFLLGAAPSQRTRDSSSTQALPGPTGVVTRAVQLPAEGALTLHAAYGTPGTDTWKYEFPDKRRISGFQLAMRTNFHEINFPVGTGSAEKRTVDEIGYQIAWDFPDVLAAQAIGMDMPKRLNAGPVVARIAFLPRFHCCSS